MEPRELAKKFIKLIQSKQWEAAYLLCTKTWKSNHDKKWLDNWFVNYDIRFIGILKVNYLSPVMADVVVKIKKSGKPALLTARVIKEKAPYEPGENGEWGVNPNSCLRIK